MAALAAEKARADKAQAEKEAEKAKAAALEEEVANLRAAAAAP